MRFGFNKIGWGELSEFFNLIHPLDPKFENQLPISKIGKKLLL